MDTAKTIAPTRLINGELIKPHSKNEMARAVTAGHAVGFGKCGLAGGVVSGVKSSIKFKNQADWRRRG